MVWVELGLGGVSTFLVGEQGAGREGRWTEALGPSIDTCLVPCLMSVRPVTGIWRPPSGRSTRLSVREPGLWPSSAKESHGRGA